MGKLFEKEVTFRTNHKKNMFRKIILTFLFSHLSVLVYSQQTLSFRLSLASTFASQTYKDLPFDRPAKNAFGVWTFSNVENGNFTPKIGFALGLHIGYKVSKKIELQTGFGFLLRRFGVDNVAIEIPHYGFPFLVKVNPINRIKNLYFLGGLRADYAFDAVTTYYTFPTMGYLVAYNEKSGNYHL